MTTKANHPITVRIADVLDVDLSLRSNAALFFEYIEEQDAEIVNVDFTHISTITRSFAHEYLSRKRLSDKMIQDINLPDNVTKMFSAVDDAKKFRIINVDSLEPIIISK